MNCIEKRTAICIIVFAVGAAFGGRAYCLQAQLGQAAPTEAARSRKVGTVKSLNGSNITLKMQSAPDILVAVQESAQMMRIAPGEKDLTHATPMQLRDVQVGDRMLVGGKPRESDQVFLADMVIVIKSADIAEKRQQDRQDWQARSTGGIVSAIDAATETITISIAPEYSVKVRTSRDTSFMRYTPGSVRFADAKPGDFQQVRIGDQLRARGNRSPDGKELVAEQVVSGTFRNIAGLLLSVDSAANTVTVSDVLSRKPVVVGIAKDSQLRKLSPAMAQGFVSLLRGIAQGSSSSPGTSASRVPPDQASSQAQRPASPQASAAPDIQRMLAQVPVATVADLQAGDAVMIVSTEASGKEHPTVMAITLVSGVEPILRAAESGGGMAAILSRWSMSSGQADQ